MEKNRSKLSGVALLLASFNTAAIPPPSTGAFRASPFSTIIPTSGKNLPYDPELGVKPVVVNPVNALPFDPDTISYTLPESV